MTAILNEAGLPQSTITAMESIIEVTYCNLNGVFIPKNLYLGEKLFGQYNPEADMAIIDVASIKAAYIKRLLSQEKDTYLLHVADGIQLHILKALAHEICHSQGETSEDKCNQYATDILSELVRGSVDIEPEYTSVFYSYIISEAVDKLKARKKRTKPQKSQLRQIEEGITAVTGKKFDVDIDFLADWVILTSGKEAGWFDGGKAKYTPKPKETSDPFVEDPMDVIEEDHSQVPVESTPMDVELPETGVVYTEPTMEEQVEEVLSTPDPRETFKQLSLYIFLGMYSQDPKAEIVLHHISGHEMIKTYDGTIDDGRYSPSIPYKGTVRCSVFRNGIPNITLHLKGEGFTQDLKIIGQNPHKTDSQGNLSKPAQRMQNGEKIAWVIDLADNRFIAEISAVPGGEVLWRDCN